MMTVSVDVIIHYIETELERIQKRIKANTILVMGYAEMQESRTVSETWEIRKNELYIHNKIAEGEKKALENILEYIAYEETDNLNEDDPNA
jgi:hypothetical protein